MNRRTVLLTLLAIIAVSATVGVAMENTYRISSDLPPNDPRCTTYEQKCTCIGVIDSPKAHPASPTCIGVNHCRDINETVCIGE